MIAQTGVTKLPGTLAASYKHCVICLCHLLLINVLPSVCLRPFLVLHCACAEPRQHESLACSGSPRTRLLPPLPPCSMWEQALLLQPLGQPSGPMLRKASCRNVASHSWSLRETGRKAGPTAGIRPLAPSCSAAQPVGGRGTPPPLLQSL